MFPVFKCLLYLRKMIPNGMRDLTESFENDCVLEHDHGVPIFGEHCVLQEVTEH